MRLWKAWTISKKDFEVFWKKKSILYTLVAFPLGIGLGLPTVLGIVHRRSHIPYGSILPLFDAFLFFFTIGTVAISNTLAAYSLVGEKTEKSLEPLLATPTTDGEILLGKVLAAFVPTISATLVGAVVFMGYVDALSYSELGYLYFPNWAVGVFLGLATPLACLMAVEANVLISSRVSDVRAAQQAGGVLSLPFAGIYVAAEIGAFQLTTQNLLALSGILALLSLGLFFASRATFRREEILTRWK